ncbi:transposase [Aggregatibacter actinomycetemcomitans]|uniref:transposase n=1 Tax=Aggregatibacter actinomycetemcomitans TaxID=714 RepID=UPI001E5BFEB0|nr:transposase [Aggregatibacter actinomycetemcomitans]
MKRVISPINTIMSEVRIGAQKRYMNYLFTFEQYADLNIEKTTNRLEGLFKELKQKLTVHNGLTRRRKIVFIKDFLNRKSW